MTAAVIPNWETLPFLKRVFQFCNSFIQNIVGWGFQREIHVLKRVIGGKSGKSQTAQNQQQQRKIDVGHNIHLCRSNRSKRKERDKDSSKQRQTKLNRLCWSLRALSVKFIQDNSRSYRHSRSVQAIPWQILYHRHRHRLLPSSIVSKTP
jgi:hypothetical protein